MIKNYKKYELFGKTLLQKIVLKPPFKYEFPINNQACLLFVREGDFQYQIDKVQIDVPTNYSLLLNCIDSGKQIHISPKLVFSIHKTIRNINIRHFYII